MLTIIKNIKDLILNLLKVFFRFFIKPKLIKKPKFVRPIINSKSILDGQIAYNKYGGYFTPISSLQRPAVQKILGGFIYEPETIKFMRKNCLNGDIIHAGTYFGDFLPGISKSVTKKSKIWAFEPNVENYICAKITILINNLNNVNLFNAGVGKLNSNSRMLIKSNSGISLGGSSRIIEGKTDGVTINVKIVKIDDIIPSESHISILQLDVEGYEKEALEGAIKTLNRCKPILILEDNNKIIDSMWFKDNILKMGYKIESKIHENTILISKA